MIECEEDIDIDLINSDQHPVYQSVQIFKTRLKSIIERLVEKIGIYSCVEELLENEGQILNEYLSPNVIVELLSMFDKSVAFSVMSQKSSMSGRCREVNNTSNIDKEKQNQIASIVKKLHFHPKVMFIVKKILEEKSDEDKKIYFAIQDFKKYVLEKMKKSATEQKNYEQYLVKIWNRNKRHKAKLIELKVVYEEKSKSIQQFLKEKQAMIDEQEKGIQETLQKCLEELQTIISSSEKYMEDISLESDDKVKTLTEVVNSIKQQYENFVETDLKMEKVLRVKEGKLETQLAQLLTKFDQDISEVYQEYDAVKSVYDELEAIYLEQLDRFNEQEEIYVPLMEEKRLEEIRVFNKRLGKLIRRRAARRIQKWWRKTLRKKFKKWRIKYDKMAAAAKKEKEKQEQEVLEASPSSMKM